MYDKANLVRIGWDEYAKRNFGHRDLSEEIEYLSKFEKLLGRNSHILDAGCGTGQPVISYFLNKNHNVTGVDISKNQLEIARRIYPSTLFLEGNILEILKNNQKYDGIVCLHSIENIQREYHKNLLDLFHNSLNDGGKLLLSHPMGAKDQVVSFVENIQMYISHFDPDTFLSIIGSTKFKPLYQASNEKRNYYILSKGVGVQEKQNTGFKHQIIFSR